MLQGEIELHCECTRCGKSAYHTVRWLRENPAVICAGCGVALPSTEVLHANSKLVRDSDHAERAR
jgi:ribosomal protein L37E